jgi:hypothetical protein
MLPCIKGQENNFQLIFVENNEFKFTKFSNVTAYQLMRKKKIDYIKIAFTDSNKIIPLERVWGVIFNNVSKEETDTFLIEKGPFSLPRTYKLIAGNINENAIFYKEQYLFFMVGNINFDKYFITEYKTVINIKSKKYLTEMTTNRNVKETLISSRKSIEWFLQRGKKFNEIRLLSLYKD